MATQGDPDRFDAVQRALGTTKLRLIYVTNVQCAALLGPVVLNITEAEPDEAVVAATRGWVDDLIKSFPSGSAFVVVIQSTAPPPGDVAKERIARIYREYERTAVAGTVVVEGTGFKAAAIRAAMNLFAFGWQYKFSSKICATVEEAGTFVGRKLPGAPSTSEISRAYGQMRLAFNAAKASGHHAHP